MATALSPTQLPARARSRARRSAMLPLALFFGGHVALGLAMHFAPSLATLHAVMCLAFGIVVAATGRATTIAAAIGYVTGAEVLWRMNGASVFWEYGKYTVVAINLVALFRIKVRLNKGLALGYLMLLLPSALLTLSMIGLDRARQQISFNLSGPLALATCAIVFSNLKLTRDDLRRVMLATLGPISAIAAIAVFSTTTASAEELDFGGSSSNYVASGGFGPNQVSAVLGLALLFSLLIVLERKMSWAQRIGAIGLATVFAIQSALTFSRAGLFLAASGAVGAALYLVRDARTRITVGVLAVTLFAAANWIVIPKLDEFTNGKLVERYTSTTSSGRSNLAGDDVNIFLDHPLLGVGPGMAAPLREAQGHIGAAHTEYTRLLSEHGVLGIAAMAVLLTLAYRVFRMTRDLTSRAMVLALLVWCGMFLAVDAMRVVAPAFAFGMACAYAAASRRAATV